MSIKKILGLAFIVVFIIVGFSITNANAASKWYTCDVVKAGPVGSSSIIIFLSDTAATPYFTSKSFYVRTGQENRQLATALSAITNGMKVWVYVDPDETTLGSRIIYNMYLLSN